MTERNRSPWPAPNTPIRRSLTWPAPTTDKGAIVPGSIVRSRYGAGRRMRVVDPGPDLLTYRLVDDEEAGDFTIYPEQVEQANGRKVTSARPAPRPVRNLRKTPPKGERMTPRARWQAWRTRRALGNKRKRIDLTIRDRRAVVMSSRERLAAHFLPNLTAASFRRPGSTSNGHTPACRKRMNGRGPGFIRTKGCPGCKALGKKGGKR